DLPSLHQRPVARRERHGSERVRGWIRGLSVVTAGERGALGQDAVHAVGAASGGGEDEGAREYEARAVCKGAHRKCSLSGRASRRRDRVSLRRGVQRTRTFGGGSRRGAP